MRQRKEKLRSFGIKINIDKNNQIIEKYEKFPNEQVKNSNRLGWIYTNAGVWSIYLLIKEYSYKINISPINSQTVIYAQLSME